MPEYYLRVSVKETETRLDQYNWFATYDKDRNLRDIFQWMLADIIRIYKLEAGRVIVEQFSKF